MTPHSSVEGIRYPRTTYLEPNRLRTRTSNKPDLTSLSKTTVPRSPAAPVIATFLMGVDMIRMPWVYACPIVKMIVEPNKREVTERGEL